MGRNEEYVLGRNMECVVGRVKRMEDNILINLNDLNGLIEYITIPSFLLSIFPHSLEPIASYTFHSNLSFQLTHIPFPF